MTQYRRRVVEASLMPSGQRTRTLAYYWRDHWLLILECGHHTTEPLKVPHRISGFPPSRKRCRVCEENEPR